MGYGTSVKLPYGTIYLNKVTLRSKYDLLSMRDEADRDIQRVKEELKMMAAGTPKDLFPDADDVFFRVNSAFNENWEALEEYFMDYWRANIVLDELDGWKWDHTDRYGELIEEKLDPDNQEDWRRIVSGDYEDCNLVRTFKPASIDELDSQIDKFMDRFLFKENRVGGKYVLYYKGKLFHDYNGLYLFSSEESAIDHFYDCMQRNFTDLLGKQNITKNKEFYTVELLNFVDPDESHSKEGYLSLIEKTLASEENAFDSKWELQEYVHRAIRNYMRQFVKIVQLNNE